STAFQMVREASDTDFIIRALQTVRGDFITGDVAPSLTYLSAEQVAGLAALNYTATASDSQIAFEIDRLDSRLTELESFFNYVIQLLRTFGINFPGIWIRPDLGV